MIQQVFPWWCAPYWRAARLWRGDSELMRTRSGGRYAAGADARGSVPTLAVTPPPLQGHWPAVLCRVCAAHKERDRQAACCGERAIWRWCGGMLGTIEWNGSLASCEHHRTWHLTAPIQPPLQAGRWQVRPGGACVPAGPSCCLPSWARLPGMLHVCFSKRRLPLSS